MWGWSCGCGEAPERYTVGRLIISGFMQGASMIKRPKVKAKIGKYIISRRGCIHVHHLRTAQVILYRGQFTSMNVSGLGAFSYVLM